MSFIAAIQISQGANCDRFTIKDISNYEESGELQTGFTQRKLIIFKSDGTVYRMPGQLTDEIDFSYVTYPDDEIVITGLTNDLALHVLMILTAAVVQSGSIYTVSNKFALVCYTKGFLVLRTKKMEANKRYEENMNYVVDTAHIKINCDQAPIAAAGDDIESAQRELDAAKRVHERNPIPY